MKERVRSSSAIALPVVSATPRNVLKELERLVTSGKKGDRLVLTFPGHGSWIADENGDEADERDEIRCNRTNPTMRLAALVGRIEAGSPCLAHACTVAESAADSDTSEGLRPSHSSSATGLSGAPELGAASCTSCAVPR
jgi:hypothetical protein